METHSQSLRIIAILKILRDDATLKKRGEYKDLESVESAYWNGRSDAFNLCLALIGQDIDSFCLYENSRRQLLIEFEKIEDDHAAITSIPEFSELDRLGSLPGKRT